MYFGRCLVNLQEHIVLFHGPGGHDSVVLLYVIHFCAKQRAPFRAEVLIQRHIQPRERPQRNRELLHRKQLRARVKLRHPRRQKLVRHLHLQLSHRIQRTRKLMRVDTAAAAIATARVHHLDKHTIKPQRERGRVWFVLHAREAPHRVDELLAAHLSHRLQPRRCPCIEKLCSWFHFKSASKRPHTIRERLVIRMRRRSNKRPRPRRYTLARRKNRRRVHVPKRPHHRAELMRFEHLDVCVESALPLSQKLLRNRRHVQLCDAPKNARQLLRLKP
mmetsp:Transcript_3809/g.8386  ORF Transcript_3809/g.8386 Transcript_3809/m.8386 type:complete len:275 (-) Transcript_3809:1893-2717(-)